MTRPTTPEAGTLGTTTHEAVVDFQRELGLDADGMIGPDTFQALVATSESG